MEVVKENTVDYGTVIVIPDNPADKDPYTFDYWQNYADGMTVTENMTFTSVYKYKNYSVAADGLSDATAVTYNSNFTIEPQEKTDYSFIGYFTDKDGKGTQITNEKGESLAPYDVVGDLTVYPYFRSDYINKIELRSVSSAMPGDSVTYKPIFATDKNASYFTATVKYPKYLTFNSVKGTSDYVEASAGTEKANNDGFKTIDITCIYDYSNGTAPVNTNLIPFELKLDVAKDAVLGNIEIGIAKASLIGDTVYIIDDITNALLEIKPKLAENIKIVGDNRIDKATAFTVTVYPDYTTDKSVTWSVDNENVATISAEGILTPVTNGTVTVTATANDDGKASTSKTVEITAYAKIMSLISDTGVWSESFVPESYNYAVYVAENTDTIMLTPSYSGGTLKLNGTDFCIPNMPQTIDLNGRETTIKFNRDNVPNMTDNVYTIKIVKYEGTKTTVSEDKKCFTVKPVNMTIEKGGVVILALYRNGKCIEMQNKAYTDENLDNDENISFTTTDDYTGAKVMVWKNLISMKPVCPAEIVK